LVRLEECRPNKNKIKNNNMMSSDNDVRLVLDPKFQCNNYSLLFSFTSETLNDNSTRPSVGGPCNVRRAS